MAPEPSLERLAVSAVQRMRSGLLVCDRDGAVVLSNPAASRILDLDGPVPPGTPLEQILAPLATLQRSRFPARPELTVRTGSTSRVLGYEVVQDGDHALVTFQDITDQVHLREERDRLLQLATVNEVLPTVLHELRNPLAAIMSAVEVLTEECEQGGESPLTLSLGSILAELRRMSLIFEGIGSVGRSLGSGRPAAIDQAARDVLRIMDRQAQAAGIQLVGQVPVLPPLPLDPSVFKSILFNLISNALYACARDGLIEVTLRLLTGSRLIVEVCDNGKGMAPEVLAACTRPFFTTRPNGSGLGLVICREAAEHAGGYLAIDSAPGKGTRVQLGLPV